MIIPRAQAIAILSEERGRAPDRPLHPTRISQWCADLGFDRGLNGYDEVQLAQLKAVNRLFALGYRRKTLLTLMKENPEWYTSLN